MPVFLLILKEFVLSSSHILSPWLATCYIGWRAGTTTPWRRSTISPSQGQWIWLMHWLNMEVDLQSLFGLHVTWCEQLYSLAETPQLPPSPRIGTRITRALLVSKDRRHLFVPEPLVINIIIKLWKTMFLLDVALFPTQVQPEQWTGIKSTAEKLSLVRFLYL